MKAESAAFVKQAGIVLARAEIMLHAGLNEDAARAAYMAGFHVAQATIFERTDKTSKSHKGVQTEFFRLTKDDPASITSFGNSSRNPMTINRSPTTSPAPMPAFRPKRRQTPSRPRSFSSRILPG